MADLHPVPSFNLGFISYRVMHTDCSFCGKRSTGIVNVTENGSSYYESCGSLECKDKCSIAVDIEYQKPYAFGSLYHLKDLTVSVRRTNGDIDDGWKICPGITESSILGMAILCTKTDSHGNNLEKIVSVSQLLELNPI